MYSGTRLASAFARGQASVRVSADASFPLKPEAAAAIKSAKAEVRVHTGERFGVARPLARRPAGRPSWTIGMSLRHSRRHALIDGSKRSSRSAGAAQIVGQPRSPRGRRQASRKPWLARGFFSPFSFLLSPLSSLISLDQQPIACGSLGRGQGSLRRGGGPQVLGSSRWRSRWRCSR